MQLQPLEAMKLEAAKNTLQANTNEIKVLSFGSKTGTKSMIDEGPKSVEFGFEVSNETPDAIFIAIVGGLGSFAEHRQTFNAGGFMDGADLLTRVGATAVLADGKIFEKEIGTSGTYNAVTVTTKNSKRKVAEMTKYAARNPFRFTRFVMTSSTINGTPESSNYNNRIKTIWLSPFEDTVEQEFSLRSIVRDKFQAQLLELDFQKDAPNLSPIMSDQNAIVIQVNAGTKLSINAYVGAQMSNAQEFYRIVTASDDLIRPIRSRM